MSNETLDNIVNTKVEFKRSAYWRLIYYFIWYVFHPIAWKLYSFRLLYAAWQLGLGDKKE